MSIVVGGLGACTSVPAAFGPNPLQARSNAAMMLGALQGRFTNVDRGPQYERAREALGRYALTPSKLYEDKSIWTSTAPDGTRILFGDASIVNGRYTFTHAPSATPLDVPGEGRHQVRLKRLREDDYMWSTNVDFAMGSVTANDMANVVSRWMASAEGRPAATLRAEYRTAFPRTTAALGQLIKVDTLISVRDAAGANTIYAGLRITPDGIRKAHPNYTKFIEKYVLRAKVRMTLTDARGGKWVDIAVRDGLVTLRLRSKDGHFVPLEGPLRAIPDTLVLRADASAKVGIFTVGVDRLIGEWVNLESAHERGWAMRFTREPEWDLPPAVGTLLRTPLRRPFQGGGVQFRIAIRDTPGKQTLLSRSATTTVNESAILRFLNKLSGAAMGDFVSTAEAEENKFNAAVFAALRADIEAILR